MQFRVPYWFVLFLFAILVLGSENLTQSSQIKNKTKILGASDFNCPQVDCLDYWNQLQTEFPDYKDLSPYIKATTLKETLFK